MTDRIGLDCEDDPTPSLGPAELISATPNCPWHFKYQKGSVKPPISGEYIAKAAKGRSGILAGNHVKTLQQWRSSYINWQGYYYTNNVPSQSAEARGS